MNSVVGQPRSGCPTATPEMTDNRCDGCPARAAFEIQLKSGKSVYLCGHHTKRNMDAFIEQGAVVTEMET